MKWENSLLKLHYLCVTHELQLPTVDKVLKDLVKIYASVQFKPVNSKSFLIYARNLARNPVCQSLHFLFRFDFDFVNFNVLSDIECWCLKNHKNQFIYKNPLWYYFFCHSLKKSRFEWAKSQNKDVFAAWRHILTSNSSYLREFAWIFFFFC